MRDGTAEHPVVATIRGRRPRGRDRVHHGPDQPRRQDRRPQHREVRGRDRGLSPLRTWFAAHRPLLATVTSGTVIAAIVATVAIVSTRLHRPEAGARRRLRLGRQRRGAGDRARQHRGARAEHDRARREPRPRGAAVGRRRCCSSITPTPPSIRSIRRRPSSATASPFLRNSRRCSSSGDRRRDLRGGHRRALDRSGRRALGLRRRLPADPESRHRRGGQRRSGRSRCSPTRARPRRSTGSTPP